MPNTFLRYIHLICLCIVMQMANAHDFGAGGLYYTFLNSNQVEVSGCDKNKSGSLAIQEKVTYNGETYQVTAIGNEAFRDCSGLTSVTIPNSVTSIEDYSFKGCSGLTSVTIPNSITSIGYGALTLCSGLTSIVVESGNTHYDSRNNCNAIVETASNTLLFGCDNTIIPNSITSIGDGAFAGYSGLTSVTIPNSVTSIGNFAFEDCGCLSSVTIPNSVTSIGVGAFYYCNALTSVTIPYSVTSIGDRAFYNCSGLKTVCTKITNPFPVNTKCFSNASNATLIVPRGTKSKYENLSGWNAFKEIKEEGVKNYNISITANGNGSASYNSTAIRDETRSFTVEEGTSAKITFTPDNGYYIWKVKVNNSLVSASNNQYTISDISDNTSVTVEFFTGDVGIDFQEWLFYVDTDTEFVEPELINPNNVPVTYISTDPRVATVDSVTGKVTILKAGATNITVIYKDPDYPEFDCQDSYLLLVLGWGGSETSEHILEITSSGNGQVTYEENSIRNNTISVSVKDGSSVTMSLMPDTGYRIAYVKRNGVDVTADVSNNSYTIEGISDNSTLDIAFEAIPPTTYTLSIESSGNGTVTYDNTAVRNNTSSFTINEGTSAKITFTPDNGYYIWKVKVNNSLVSVSNNQYTISDISDNTSVTVEFFTGDVGIDFQKWLVYVDTDTEFVEPELINPNSVPVTYISTDSRVATVDSVTGKVTILKAGATNIAAIYKDPDYPEFDCRASYLLMVLGWGGSETSEHILEITSSGNGQVTYEENSIRNNTISVSVKDGSSVTMSLMPDTGYRIAYVKRNGVDVTADVSNNNYTIEGISDNSTLDIAFEAIPPITYTLSITSSGNGSVTYDNISVRNNTRSFSIDEGLSATLTFTPDNGHRIKNVKVNNLTVSTSNNQYTIPYITNNTSVEIIYEIIPPNELIADGINYKVVSQSEKTVMVVGGDYGQVLTIPATVSQDGTTWKVTGIEKDALKDIAALCAVIWEPEALFTADVSNPNLLLYVKDAQHVPADIKNVVVNGSAASITLVDANSGNSFFCPQAFTAHKISYTHHYGMITGIGESRGWETIALPFDVQTVTHVVKGACHPFANWKSGDDARPFWLYELTGNGFAEAASIEAYTPYVISMPNHPRYEDKWILRGNVTFAATNTVVKKTEDVKTVTYGDRTFEPCFTDIAADAGFYALNVNNDLSTNTNGMTEGSRFVLNMRKIHPFEAYMISTSNASRLYFDIFERVTTAIKEIEKDLFKDEQIYDLQGRKTQTPHKKGIYVTDGKKLIVR